VFEWNERQRADLEALWRHPSADGARERLARDLARHIACSCARVWRLVQRSVAQTRDRADRRLCGFDCAPRFTVRNVNPS
jgi:hypothetical protein